MKNKQKIAAIWAMCAMLASPLQALCAEISIPYETEAEYRISYQMPVSEFYPGDTVYLTVSLSAPVAVYGAEVAFTYDADMLCFQKAVPSEGADEITEVILEKEEGQLLYAFTHRGRAAVPPLSSRALTLTFLAKQSGTAKITPSGLKIVQEDMSVQSFAPSTDEIVVVIQEKQTPTAPPIRPSGGGGGGGISISGGNSVAAKPPIEPTLAEEEVDAPQKEDLSSAVGMFSDLQAVPWAVEAIETLGERGILNGKSSACFAPMDVLSRAEAAKLLTHAFSLQPKEEKKIDFLDVKEEAWYSDDVQIAAQNGIIQGDENGYFHPEDAVTREEFAAMLYRVIALQSITLPPMRLNRNFTDEAEISDYAVGCVDYLYISDIMEGDEGYFRPSAALTRAEAAVSVYRVLSKTEGGAA